MLWQFMYERRNTKLFSFSNSLKNIFEGLFSGNNSIPNSLLFLTLNCTLKSSRIVEWLKTMRTIQNLPEEYFRLFYYCLAVFKNDNYLLQWTDRKKIILL